MIIALPTEFEIKSRLIGDISGPMGTQWVLVWVGKGAGFPYLSTFINVEQRVAKFKKISVFQSNPFSDRYLFISFSFQSCSDLLH